MKNYINFDNKTLNNYSLKYHFFTFFKKIELALFIAISLIFLVTSKINSNFTNKVSYFFVDISLPIVNLLASPFNLTIDLIANFQELTNARQENAILKKQNEAMQKSLIESIRIANENRELRELLQFSSLKSVNYQMAKVIGKTHQYLSHHLFIESKKGSNIKDGSAVVTSTAMIGRAIKSVGNRARILLVTDANSKIPVIISGAKNRAILAGNNSNLMELKYVSKNHQIKVDDLVFTSNDGENLAPGILVGIVKKIDGKNIYVEMAQDVLDVDVVTILNY